MADLGSFRSVDLDGVSLAAPLGSTVRLSFSNAWSRAEPRGSYTSFCLAIEVVPFMFL